MSDHPDADVVICSWAGDDREVTLQCLRATADQAAAGRVHLVDMSPTSDLADAARAIPGIVVHWHPESSGLGESRQRGLEGAAGRYVAFLDSDALPREGWLAALRDTADAHDVAVAGGPVFPLWPAEPRRPWLFTTHVAGDFLSMLDLGASAMDVPRVLPGNMLVDREVTGEMVFSRELGRRPGDLLGAEEIAMMIRVRAEGRRIVYTPDAAVNHHTRPERMSWRWLWRRLHAAGREAAMHGDRLEPLPRKLTARDRLALALAAPAFLHGRYFGARRDASAVARGTAIER